VHRLQRHARKGQRPYDKDRDGFVMGEGAGIVVLEEYEHAKARGAKIYAEVIGYGLAGDAYHITAPAEDGDGGFRAMKAAIKDAGIDPSDIDYINAHGTSTMATDRAGRRRAPAGRPAAKVAVSSTKSATATCWARPGPSRRLLTVLAIRDQIAPPTINLDNPDVETPIDLVPTRPSR
jgi:3-oxoacyl-[acyl-carrier-protein] synthase II